MRKLPRTLWEIIIFLVLGVVVFGGWKYQEWNWQSALAQHDEQWQAELAAERERADAVQAVLVNSEAEAVVHAFAAGIHPAVLAERSESIDLALGRLLELPHIVFAHVLRSDGTVVATSDRKLASAGHVGERGAWVLDIEEETVKQGTVDGTTEIVLPLESASEVGFVLWVAHDTDRLLETAEQEAAGNPAGSPQR